MDKGASSSESHASLHSFFLPLFFSHLHHFLHTFLLLPSLKFIIQRYQQPASSFQTRRFFSTVVVRQEKSLYPLPSATHHLLGATVTSILHRFQPFVSVALNWGLASTPTFDFVFLYFSYSRAIFKGNYFVVILNSLAEFFQFPIISSFQMGLFYH